MSWHWLDKDEIWIEYGEMNSEYNAISNINSSYIENKYTAFINGTGGPTLGFRAENHQYTLNFETMTQQNDSYGTEKKVKRTPESVKPRLKRTWYWKEENGKWIRYGQPYTQRKVTSTVHSWNIEEKYTQYKNKHGSSTMNFEVGNHQYILDFVAMTQRNIKFGTIKKVCREITIDDKKIPNTWDLDIFNAEEQFQLVNVVKSRDINDGEYERVYALFAKTLPKANIVKLERIQNVKQWKKFADSELVAERQLFHATSHQHIDGICRESFDMRLNGNRTGTLYGKGNYFARDSKESQKYAEKDGNNVFKMFIARVLVGSYTKGTDKLLRPPYKDALDPAKGMFNSCVDCVDDPTIFVTFDNNQSYPEYLISYCIGTDYVPTHSIEPSGSSICEIQNSLTDIIIEDHDTESEFDVGTIREEMVHNPRPTEIKYAKISISNSNSSVFAIPEKKKRTCTYM